jgi:hypothetical protein
MLHHARPIKRHAHLALMPFTAVLLVLVGCGHGYEGDNCSSPIAATYTARCNQYLDRQPGAPAAPVLARVRSRG